MTEADDGGRWKWLPIVDEHCRELLSLQVGRSITGEDVGRMALLQMFEVQVVHLYASLGQLKESPILIAGHWGGEKAHRSLSDRF